MATEGKNTEGKNTMEEAAESKRTGKETKQEFLEEVKEKADHVVEDLKVGASSLWEKVKIGAERLGEFAEDATELGKLKYDIHKLERSLAKRFLQMGEKLWVLHENDDLGKIKSTFGDDFKQIASLKEELQAKKRKAEAISLVE